MALLYEPPFPSLLFLFTNKCRWIKPEILLSSFLYLSQGHIAKHSFLLFDFPSLLLSNHGHFLEPHVRLLLYWLQLHLWWTVLSTLTASHLKHPLCLSPNPWKYCSEAGTLEMWENSCLQENPLPMWKFNASSHLVGKLQETCYMVSRLILQDNQTPLAYQHSNKQLRNDPVIVDCPCLITLAPYYSGDPQWSLPKYFPCPNLCLRLCCGDLKLRHFKILNFFLIIVSRFGRHVIIVALAIG